MAKELFSRYIWLVEMISRNQPLTFEEINEKWKRSSLSDGVELPRRTFHNHKTAIEETFGIVISCNKSHQYYIEGMDDKPNTNVRTWLLSNFSISNLLTECQSLKDRILLENIPSGQHFLSLVLEAMRDSITLNMTYQTYWYDSPYTIDIELYFVKLFKQIWYLVGRNPFNDKIKIYALDRMQSLAITDKHFTFPADFDPQAFFFNNYGIIVGDKPAGDIIVKVNSEQVKYWRSLPLHHSQEEVLFTDDHSVFSFFLHPTFDFMQALLSQGDNVEVISPKSLRKEMRDIIKRMEMNYSDDNEQE